MPVAPHRYHRCSTRRQHHYSAVTALSSITAKMVRARIPQVVVAIDRPRNGPPSLAECPCSVGLHSRGPASTADLPNRFISDSRPGLLAGPVGLISSAAAVVAFGYMGRC